MVKLGILSDTHDIDTEENHSIRVQIKNIFKDTDYILCAGDICSPTFLDELKEIAPIYNIKGEADILPNLKEFERITIDNINIGIIHKLPGELENFCEEKQLFGGILIYGHTHQPIIEGTTFNTLLLNPGSPTQPVAPKKIKGFDIPQARPSVITLSIENGIVTSFIINLKL